MSQTRPQNLGNQEVLLGYVYNYKFYGFGDFKNKITIVNVSGSIVDDSNDSADFNELNQRALLPNKLFLLKTEHYRFTKIQSFQIQERV